MVQLIVPQVKDTSKLAAANHDFRRGGALLFHPLQMEETKMQPSLLNQTRKEEET